MATLLEDSKFLSLYPGNDNLVNKDLIKIISLLQSIAVLTVWQYFFGSPVPNASQKFSHTLHLEIKAKKAHPIMAMQKICGKANYEVAAT